MIKFGKNICLSFLIIIIWGYVTNQYIEFTNNMEFIKLIENVLFNPQKILFNNMLIFLICVCVNSVDVNRIEYVIRNRKNIFVVQIMQGIIICLAYSVLLIITIMGNFFIKNGISENILLPVLFSIFRLFIINYMFYIVFAFFSMVTKKIIAMCIIYSLDFIILTGWSMYSFFYTNSSLLITQNIWFDLGVIIAVLFINYCYLKKKEYY